jgi:MinD superfamily P-loop ATPase
MRELVIISGKGGTGKTSITAALATLADNIVLADCDVDAPDLHILLDPRTWHEEPFSGGKLAAIDESKCIRCGRCQALCRFNAVYSDANGQDIATEYMINPRKCEGCGVCVQFCPSRCIDFSDAVNGKWFISDTRLGPMVHAQLGIAQENSGKLVTLIRKEARQLADNDHRSLIIIDGSPGTGCPVIASVGGADLVLIVTEPTLSGQHDLERVIELADHFKVPACVCINKSDINPEQGRQIQRFVESRNLPIVGTLPYDRKVTEAQTAGKTLVEYSPEDLKQPMQALWSNIQSLLENTHGENE